MRFADVEEPDLAIGEIVDEGGVGGFAEGAGPDDLRVFEIGGVVDPFIVEKMARVVLDEDQVAAGVKLRILGDQVGSAEAKGIGGRRGGSGDGGCYEPGADCNCGGEFCGAPAWLRPGR